MDVSHLIDLAGWYEKTTPSIIKLYGALVNVLNNNANQASKQPVREPLDQLTTALDGMDIERLSIAQIAELETLQIAEGAVLGDAIS